MIQMQNMSTLIFSPTVVVKMEEERNGLSSSKGSETMPIKSVGFFFVFLKEELTQIFKKLYILTCLKGNGLSDSYGTRVKRSDIMFEDVEKSHSYK